MESSQSTARTPKVKATRRTSMLIAPTLDEVKKAAADIGLPEREAIRFFNFYESKGWMVGSNRMVNFTGALANWKMGWEDRGGSHPSTSRGQVHEVAPSPMDKMIYQKEYERIVARMQTIRASYGEMQSWSQSDKVEYGKLSKRKIELKNLLGVVI